MPDTLEGYTHRFGLTGDLAVDAARFLTDHACQRTAEHCAAVARTARELALRFDVSGELAWQAGWLHDVSAVVPVAERLHLARALGLEVLPAEAVLPMILHQRLSAEFARAVFAIDDPDVLSAIRCHTTLRPGATQLDCVVFLADKIAWDQPGDPPYLPDLRAALARSLREAVCVYLEYLWRQRDRLPVVHPWFEAAYAEICQDKMGGSENAI